MCGIVGYIGQREAEPILVEGLRRLEYRGYDSAGVATITGDKLHLRKRAGRIVELAKHLRGRPRPVRRHPGAGGRSRRWLGRAWPSGCG